MSYEEDHGYELFGQNLFMAATERERKTLSLTNEKKRREFVNNSDNWEIVGEMNSLVRLTRLEYKGKEWYGIEIRSGHDVYDAEIRRLFKKDWLQIAIYQLDTDNRCFTYPWSRSQVATQLKLIDKEEKK